MTAHLDGALRHEYDALCTTLGLQTTDERQALLRTAMSGRMTTADYDVLADRLKHMNVTRQEVAAGKITFDALAMRAHGYLPGKASDITITQDNWGTPGGNNEPGWGTCTGPTTWTPTMTDCTIEITGERKTGKTQAALSIAVAHAISGRHVLYTAGSQAAATEAIRRVIDMMPVAKSTITPPGRQRTDTPNGGRIYFVSRTSGTGRGMTADTLILDEWDGNQRHQEDLIPALNCSRDPRIVIARSAER